MYFSQYFAVFFLNICIFLKKSAFVLEKIHSFKTAMHLAPCKFQMDFVGACRRKVQTFQGGDTAKGVEICRRKACALDSLAASIRREEASAPKKTHKNKNEIR